MKKLIVFSLAGLSMALSATAGGHSQTVCVLRSRPVAIQPRPVHRPVQATPSTSYYSSGGHAPEYSNYGYSAYAASAYRYSPYYGYKVPVIYGYTNPRLHYVNPCIPNGYIGGLRNLPTNVVQIPPTFGKPVNYGGPRPGPHPVPHASHPSNAPRPAAPAPAARAAR